MSRPWSNNPDLSGPGSAYGWWQRTYRSLCDTCQSRKSHSRNGRNLRIFRSKL